MLNIGVEPKKIIELSLRFFNARIFHFESIDSTNTYLKEYAHHIGFENLKPNEAVCAVADEQTAGRGRMDRNWHSPHNEGLYFSILIKSKIEPTNIPMLTLMAAVASAETIGANCSNALDIKWPNDILIKGRKVAGILTEAGFESDRLNYAIVGIGINLNQKIFPEEIRQLATSLYIETQREFSRDQFMLDLLARIDEWYITLSTEPQQVLDRWRELSSFARDKMVRVIVDGCETRVRTCGLEPSGALRVRSEDGREITLHGGEIIGVDEG